MVMGIIVTVYSAHLHQQGGNEACSTNSANYTGGLLMYASYFLLFFVLFINKYCCSDLEEEPTKKLD